MLGLTRPDSERARHDYAVKHFKFEPLGKRRLDKRPNGAENWSLTERAIPIQINRCTILNLANGLRLFVPMHPSALLRLQDEEEQDEEEMLRLREFRE